jgi:hypothetical protein
MWLYVWKPDDPSRVLRAPYTCRSWRCPFGCADHESHVLYCRMQEAFAEAPAKELVFCVLNLDSHLHRMRGKDLAAVYQDLGQRAMYFRRRLRRFCEERGIPHWDNRWLQVVEQHESGVPHINFVIHSPELAAWIETRRRERRREGRSKQTARLVASIEGFRDDDDLELHQHLTECGFGFRSTWEVANDRNRVISYMNAIAKHANETAGRISSAQRAERGARRRRLRRVTGELVKNTQLPYAAPRGTRRVRSGIEFLPPRHKGENTGCVVMRVRTSRGEVFVRTLTDSKDPELFAMQGVCLQLEHRAAEEERDRSKPSELRDDLEDAIVHEAIALASKQSQRLGDTAQDREDRAKLVALYRRQLATSEKKRRAEKVTIHRIPADTLANAFGRARAGPEPTDAVGPPLDLSWDDLSPDELAELWARSHPGDNPDAGAPAASSQVAGCELGLSGEQSSSPDA